MTAEIIQFGKPQSISAKFKPARQKSVQRPAKLEAKPEKEAVLCTVDGRLYEVKFHGHRVHSVCAVHYSCSSGNGRIETLRYQHWSSDGFYNRRELDPAVVGAATRARGQSGAEASSRERAIAQLRDRHARLMRDAEKVEAIIAILQRGIN